MIIVPQSRLKRELRKWLRHLDKYPDDVIHITHNREEKCVLLSPELYDEYVNIIKEFDNATENIKN